MFEGKPPYSEIHPMRVIFMIPAKQPPTLKEQDKCSPLFVDFISKCLVKNPKMRSTASDLLQHEFIKSCQTVDILKPLIEQANQIKYANEVEFKNRQKEYHTSSISNKLDFDSNNLTLINNQTLINSNSNSENNKNFQTVKSNFNQEEDEMGTMIINKENEKENEEDEYQTGTFNSIKINESLTSNGKNAEFLKEYNPVTLLSNLNKQPNNANVMKTPLENEVVEEEESIEESTRIKNLIHREVKAFNSNNSNNNPNNLSDKNNYIYNLSYSDIKLRLKYMDIQMQEDLNELKKKFEKKRQTILEAIEIKKKDTKIF
jgi:serine/threonine kinase 3